MSNVSWDSSAEDFGQKVDLTVRIREILRNYPEGLSILKELIQNADDAGARTIKFCIAESRYSQHENSLDTLSDVLKGPSLLAYNSAKFNDVDFKSIQRIGDSLKKDAKGTKTGRFGIGFNSTYHLTDVPMFVSGCKIVMFDPQAKFVPGINPANPGKLVDCAKSNGRKLVGSLPHVFEPLKVFGCKLEGEDFEGTTFRFALRTEEQAKTSRLSRQFHKLEKMRDLLKQMASAAPSMLLFLKNVECIEIYDWKCSDDSPLMVHRTRLSNSANNIQLKRSYVLNAPQQIPPKPINVDYILRIESDGIGVLKNGGEAHELETWIVCNQLGGGKASQLAKDPNLSHMKLIPWAGVAARLSPPFVAKSGNAYCFLPIPVQTALPVHVNGYFELSSNRRDVWSGNDMAGDGKVRAEWNESIIQDICAPSYIRLLTNSIRTKSVTNESYEYLFPHQPLSGIWALLGQEFFAGIRKLPVLYSECNKTNKWVTPAQSLLLHDDSDTKLAEIFSLDQVPLVMFQNKEMKEMLLSYGTCKNTTIQSTVLHYFSRRKNLESGALESPKKTELAEYLLSYCLKDLKPSEYNKLEGCQFIPLANGNLGRFCSLANVDDEMLQQLTSMGFSKLSCIHSLRMKNGNINEAMEWLLQFRYEDEAVTVEHGIDPYLVCDEESASLLMHNSPHTFVYVDKIQDTSLKNFFTSGAASAQLNMIVLRADMLADVVARCIPRGWRGNEHAQWNADYKFPNVQWFVDLWNFICKCDDVHDSLASLAEQYCIVPTHQDVVCTLSPSSSVIDGSDLERKLINCITSLGVRELFTDILPSDVIVPKKIWNYVFQSNREGVIKAIDTAVRSPAALKEGFNRLDQASVDVKKELFQFFAVDARKELSVTCKKILCSFPIFCVYTEPSNLETKFVPLVLPGTWYVLKDATEEDAIFMGSDFLVCNNDDEVKLVCSLGAKQISRAKFYIKVVIPQLNITDNEVRNQAVKKMLLDLSSLASMNPGFDEILSQTRCIPTLKSKTLKAPKELYDPQVSQLVNLMGEDAFPDEDFMSSEVLLSLRKLGLQSILSWSAVLECAQSIECEGSSDGSKAKSRGRELLVFLDMNFETFFPDSTAKNAGKSRTGMLFEKFNRALFQDSEQMKKDKELQMRRVHELLSIKWIPVHNKPPHPLLPWPEICEHVSTPLSVTTVDKMWLASYSKRLLDGDVHSIQLKKIFGWLDKVNVEEVALQLRMLGKVFCDLRETVGEQVMNSTTSNENEKRNVSLTKNDLCQKVSSEVGRIYHILNNIESDYDKEVMASVLHGSRWLWMGNTFVSSDHVAYSSSIDATPYLFTVPPDLACFRNLLSCFNVRDTFRSNDLCFVLSQMAEELKKAGDGNTCLDSKRIELAVNVVQKISDDVLRLKDLDIFVPTQDGNMVLANNLVYDDAPWLSKDLMAKKHLIYAHSKLSASVCEKVGVKSVRKILLQSNTNMINFGDTIVHEAFGQSESLTRRLKNIVEMYPEGPQQLNELIQNADDAQATTVKFLLSKKQYGTSSLLGQKMSEWQGGALYCYNNSTFSDRDFQNLAKIGQASKLQKVTTTGRFGLGFNSVFHWTDVPQLVSGDYLVMFDPHARYVPGATDLSRGIKIRFSNSDLVEQFPHQMMPYLKFGCDMKHHFQGTLFRFPFRNSSTAAESEISKKKYGEDGAFEELLENFKRVISKAVLFLRNVTRVEFYLEEEEDDSPKLLYYANVVSREALPASPTPELSPMTSLDNIFSMATNALGIPQHSNDWNAIASFISGSNTQSISKEGFYNKLLRTPENMLPKTKHIVTILFYDASDKSRTNENNEKESMLIKDQYLVCSALGAGKCRVMACSEKLRDQKFIPWGSVAAHLKRNDEDAPETSGNAFCFLPLPAETGFLNVHINGYFELSANRRDIWFGDDMTGSGKIRSEWNRLLLSDVIAPLYSQLLLSARFLIGPGKQYDMMWPVNTSSEIWKVVRSRLYQIVENLPVVYSMHGSGKWVGLKSAVFLGTPKDGNEEGKNNFYINTMNKLRAILLEEEVNVVSMSQDIIDCMKDELCNICEVNPSMVRKWFKKPREHPSLREKDNVTFLLSYCVDDLFEAKRLHELHGLPLLPLSNGLIGTIAEPESLVSYYVASEAEKRILECASYALVDVWTDNSRLNGYLTNKDFYLSTNVKALNKTHFVELLSHSFPSEWSGFLEVQWVINTSSKSATPENPVWLSLLWEYIISANENENSDIDLTYLENTLQIVPTAVGNGKKTLQQLHRSMAVVNMTDANDEVKEILHSIGIRTLDSNIFNARDRPSIVHKLKTYIQSPTVRGIITAMSNSSVDEISYDERIKKMALRFKYLNKTEKVTLRTFLCDCDDIELTKEEKMILRSLPIFEVFDLGKNVKFSNLSSESYIPPLCADQKHLNSQFVKATDRRYLTFLERLGLKTMSPREYNISYLVKVITEGQIDEHGRKSACYKLLQDLPALDEDAKDQNLYSLLSEVPFVPNSHGKLVKPNALYDPRESEIISLLSDAMLPAKELHHSPILQSLAMMGMRTKLSSDGIIESAKLIEKSAKAFSNNDIKNEDDILALRKRAISLLNFLDNDETIHGLLSEVRVSGGHEKELDIMENLDEVEVELDMDSDGNNFFKELSSICWLPVERTSKNNVHNVFSPPRLRHELSFVGISSPHLSRPKPDDWICSSEMDILAVAVKSDELMNVFHWNEPPNIYVLASQIVALSQLNEKDSQQQALRQIFAKVTSQIYELLENQIEIVDLESKEKVLMLFRDNPWIWVGDRFVKASQVAYEAPDNAKPFLYPVPNSMACFSILLKSVSIKECFNGKDFVNLLSSLRNDLEGSPCTSKQLDLAIYVSKSLSRLPHDELMACDKSCIFLPSREGTLHRAGDMTFDDAPWLSAIVKRTQHLFVHRDVGNECARVLGARSLRDVLSANQNGMVKVPCPKHESLHQMLKKREMNHEEVCRVVLELVEIAEMKGVKQVSVTLDLRSHDTVSLLHPCLASAQNSSLIICFHDVAIEVDEILKLTSPTNYYSSTIGGKGGCGGKGFPRFGRGLCGSFSLTDCLQVLTGRSFLIFDPNGEYFVEDNLQQDTSQKLKRDEEDVAANISKYQKRKSNARNYGLSYSFCKQFPDQFVPFLSLPFGVEQSMKKESEAGGGSYYRGTILRIPFRTKDSPPSGICDHVFDDKDFESLTSMFSEVIPQTLLFTYHLQGVSFNMWSTKSSCCERVLDCRVSSSPLSRRDHIEGIQNNSSWRKDKSKLGKFFKNAWNAVVTSHTLQISSRVRDSKTEIVDTFIITSVLAPARLREMACTKSLTPLQLIPSVTIAAHVNRTPPTASLNTSSLKPAEGYIFVGLSTGIKTGFPFHINAPLFLHEWTGNVLINQEDDADFKTSFPGIRDVTITDKHNIDVTRSLALYVWNRQAITSAVSELVAPMMKQVKTSLECNWDRNPRLLYRFWPYFSRIHGSFKGLIDGFVYKSLASEKMDIFLTEQHGFKSIMGGCFASPDYPLGAAADFFLNHVLLFATPKLVVEDLARFNVGCKQLTPSIARLILKENQHVQHVNNRLDEMLSVLEYCLADLVKLVESNNLNSLATICRRELVGLMIIPLSDGSIGKVGNQYIIASAQQQIMLPRIKNKFLWQHAVKKLESLLSVPEFTAACSLEKFGPKILSRHISTVLPSSWKDKNFVDWNVENNVDSSSVPSKLWIFQFWKEVPIWNHDIVQLFRRWPLIPTKTGELASCANARYIIYVCPAAVEQSVRSSLLEDNRTLLLKIDEVEKRDQFLRSKEKIPGNNIEKRSSIQLEADKEYWDLGKDDETANLEKSDIENTNASIDGNGDEDEDNSNIRESNNSSTRSEVLVQSTQDEAMSGENTHDGNSPNGHLNTGSAFDIDSSSFHSLFKILSSIQCPLLDASFFKEAELLQILPTDRLGVSRAILSSLNQCLNYWPIMDSSSEERLRWSKLNSSDFDELLSFLSTHQGNRLSLMASDLDMIKTLPVFETFCENYISISERDENFTVDNSVNIDSIGSYLPISLQRKLLLDKPQFKELYNDLNIRVLNEASIMQQFVLKEFTNMPISQKESVIQNIIEKWNVLRGSDELVNKLKDTAFVKRKKDEEIGDIIFVKANQLFDPRNNLLRVILDKDSSCFPAEEFTNEESLEMLEQLGMITTVDKDTFLKCAWIVEEEQSISKALILFEYFNEHIGDFYDHNQGDFIRNLAEVCCVPVIEEQATTLSRFRDAAAPKDKHLTFKVMPTIHRLATPPQVMFSSLGIISPPPISIVLKQLKALSDNESILDHWNYKDGTVDIVFSEIFSYLQDNFSDLSPKIQEGLRVRPVVPVGSTLVRANCLFFRLNKDLAPFFYEVPRAFGAYDVFLRNLGVRENPKSGDYSLALKELKREIGSCRLNANELKSVVEIVNLAAADDQNPKGGNIIAPDIFGKLVNVDKLLQNDSPWLTHGRKLDLDLIHLVHPKLSKDICKRLQIRFLSESICEVLDDNCYLKSVKPHPQGFERVEGILHTDAFCELLSNLAPNLSSTTKLEHVLKSLSLRKVETIGTRFVLLDASGNVKLDVTNKAYDGQTYCFMHNAEILISDLPLGMTTELAIANCLCEAYQIPKQFVSGVCAVLSSSASNILEVQRNVGLYRDEYKDELLRGNPGQPLVSIDVDLAVIKPLKVFKKGEIVAVKESTGTQLIYGVVQESGEGSGLSRLRICVGSGKERTLMSSEVYSLGRSKIEEKSIEATSEHGNKSLYGGVTLESVRGNDDNFEDDLEPLEVNVLAPVNQEEVMTAVQDLLRSANLSLNQDAKEMLSSNLSLQNELEEKKVEIETLQRKTKTIGNNAMKGMESFLCPITRDLMEDPVICSDGHTYERSAIEMWLRNNSRSPKTNQHLVSRSLIPNHSLRNAIEALSSLRESLLMITANAD